MQNQPLIFAVGIGHDQLVSLRGRLACDGHVSDARREGAPHAKDLLEDGVADAVRRIPQRTGRTDEFLARNALTRQGVDQIEFDGDLAAVGCQDAPDRDVVVAGGFPIRRLNVTDRGRSGRHPVPRQGLETAAAAEVVLNDLGHIQSAVGRHRAGERHDSNGNRVADARGNLDLQLRLSRAGGEQREREAHRSAVARQTTNGACGALEVTHVCHPAHLQSGRNVINRSP